MCPVILSPRHPERSEGSSLPRHPEPKAKDPLLKERILRPYGPQNDETPVHNDEMPVHNDEMPVHNDETPVQNDDRLNQP